jgi:hypothetical protein
MNEKPTLTRYFDDRFIEVTGYDLLLIIVGSNRDNSAMRQTNETI